MDATPNGSDRQEPLPANAPQRSWPLDQQEPHG